MDDPTSDKKESKLRRRHGPSSKKSPKHKPGLSKEDDDGHKHEEDHPSEGDDRKESKAGRCHSSFSKKSPKHKPDLSKEDEDEHKHEEDHPSEGDDRKESKPRRRHGSFSKKSPKLKPDLFKKYYDEHEQEERGDDRKESKRRRHGFFSKKPLKPKSDLSKEDNDEHKHEEDHRSEGDDRKESKLRRRQRSFSKKSPKHKPDLSEEDDDDDHKQEEDHPSEGVFSKQRKRKSKYDLSRVGTRHRHRKRTHAIIDENELSAHLKRLTPLYRRKIFFDQLKRYWYVFVIITVFLTAASVGLSLVLLPSGSDRLIEIAQPSPIHGRWGILEVSGVKVNSIIEGLKNKNMSVIRMAETSIKDVYVMAGIPIEKVSLFLFNDSNSEKDHRDAVNKNTIVLEHTAFLIVNSSRELDINSVVRAVRKVLLNNDSWIFDPNLLSARQGNNHAVANSIDSFMRSDFPRFDLQTRRARMISLTNYSGCRALQKIINGNLSPDDCLEPTKVRTGLSCATSCNQNFILSGSALRTCLSSGTWSGSEARCEMPCPFLTHPAHGVVSPRICLQENAKSKLLMGVSCNYFCSSGYYLIGSFRTVCQADGTWSSRTPICKRFCFGVVLPENGHVVPKSCAESWVGEETFCSFFCDDGYVMLGETTTVCGSDGSWSSETPICKNTCPALPKLYNVKVHPSICASNKVDIGTRCAFTCEEGYTMLGPKERTCDLSGHWTGMQTECIKICPKIGYRQYLLLSAECAFQPSPVGTVCSMSCVNGFAVDGADTLTCQNDGSWNKNVPICRAVCVPFGDPEVGYIICSGSIEGASCSLFCPQKHVLVGAGSVICLDDGTWSEPLGRCVNTCPKYILPEYAEIHPSKCGFEMSLAGQLCRLECRFGFAISGSFQTECLEDGTWSYNSSSCSKEKQFLIRFGKHGSMCLKLDNDTLFAIKSDWVDCIPGVPYTKWTILSSGLLRNTDTNLCLAAQSAGSMSFLVGKSCDESDKFQVWDWPKKFGEGYSLKLKNYDLYIWDGYVTLSKVVVTNHIAHLQYDWILHDITNEVEYSFFGALNNGECPALDNGSNGRWSPSSCSKKGSRNLSFCAYLCLSGYATSEQLFEKQCVNGLWSTDDIPQCTAACEGLSTDVNSDLFITPDICTEKYVGQETICAVTCVPGTLLVGEHHLVCLIGGVWSNSLPICVPLCSKLVVTGSGHVKHSSLCVDNNGLHRNGSVCEVECDESFILSTSAFYICKNGDWDNEQPICKRKCEKPELSAHGISSCENGLKFYVEGESCTFACEPEYTIPNNVTTITCLASGLWSHNTPSCKRICPSLIPTIGMTLSPVGCSDTEQTLEDTMCTAFCDPGYILSGSRVRTCLSTGIWSGYPSKCDVDKQFFIWNNNANDKRCLYAKFYPLHNKYRVVLTPYNQCSKTDMGYLWNAAEDEKIRNAESNLCLGVESIQNHALVILSSCDGTQIVRWQYILKFGQYVITNVENTYYLHRIRNSTFVELESSFDESFEDRDSYDWRVTDLYFNNGSVPGIAYGKCPKASLPEGVSFASYDLECHFPVDIGSNCTMVCSHGSQIGTPNAKFINTCLEYGLWSTINIDCSYKTCPPITLPPNSSIRDETCTNTNSSTSGAKICEIACDLGFVKRADNHLYNSSVCLINGKWSESVPKCLNNCSYLSAPINGSVSSNCTGDNLILDGDMCEFFCDFNHEMLGNHTITCVAGTWSEPSPTCKSLHTVDPINCPGLTTPTNGYLTPSSCSQSAVTYNTECTFRCDTGYATDRKIPLSTRCQSNGKWTNPDNRCLKVCNIFDFVSESNRDLEAPKFKLSPERCNKGNNTEGDVCFLDCIDDYEVFAGPYLYDSPTFIECQKNGTWSLSSIEYANLYRCLKVPQFKIQSRDTELCINAITDSLVTFASCNTHEHGAMWVFYQHLLKNRKNLTLCLSIDSEAVLSTVSLAPCSLSDKRQMWDCGIGNREYEIVNYYIDVKLGYVNNTNRVFAIKTRNSDLSWTAPSFFDPKDGKDEWTPIKNEHVCGRRSGADMCMIRKWSNIENGHVSSNCQLQTSTTSNFNFIKMNTVCTFHCNENYTLIGSTEAKCLWRGEWKYKEEPKCVRMCPPINVPEFATAVNKTCSSQSSMPGQKCDFVCDQNFFPAGDLSFVCLPTGLWDGVELFCYKPCAPIKLMLASTIQPVRCIKEPQIAGTVCTTTCRDGYEISSKSTQLCQQSGEWSNPQGFCAILCPILPPITDGFVAPADCFSSKKKPGSTCIFRCNPGYKLIGEESRVCGVSGLWSGKNARCLRKCPMLHSPPNGFIVLQSGHENAEGAIARTTCNTDYTVDRNPLRECRSNGLWSGVDVSCKYEKQFNLLQSSLPSPSICIFTDDRFVVRLSTIVECNLSSPWGKWAWYGSSNIRNVATNKCLAVSSGSIEKYLGLADCSDSDAMQMWRCSIVNYKTVLSLRDSDSIPVYSSLSASKILLLSTNIIEFLSKKSIASLTHLEWYAGTSQSNYTSLCSVKENQGCHGFQEDAQLLVPPKCGKPIVPIGTVCSIQCKQNFVAKSHVPDSICLNSGYWSENLPNCVPACKALDIDKRVQIQPDNCIYDLYLPEDQICRFSCPSTDELVGDSILTCMGNGKWSSAPPICKRTCVPLNVPLLGSVFPETCTDISQRVVEGTECVISCLQHDHVLSGSETRVCKENGKWSGFNSECIKPCNILDQPAHSIVTPAICLRGQAPIGTICSLKCSDGYFPTETYYRHCLENGTWSENKLYCQIYCPAIEIDALDGAVYPLDCLHSNKPPGSKCSIKCDTGYEVIGSKFVSCSSEGHWKGKLGVCTRKCPRLQKPINGNIQPSVCLNGEIYSGTICAQFCQKNYILMGSDVRTCLRDGNWTGTDAECLRSCKALGSIESATVSPVLCSKYPQPVHTNCTVNCANSTLDARGLKVISLTCLPSGFWDPMPPKQCFQVCEVPQMSNGQISCEDHTDLNPEYVFEKEKCSVHCDKFHVHISHPISSCVAGIWYPPITHCKYIPYPLVMVQRIGFDTTCLGIMNAFVIMYPWEKCNDDSAGSKWAWKNHYSIINLNNGLCLTALSPTIDESIIVSSCDDNSALQKWDCGYDEPYRIFLGNTSLGPGRRYPELPEITLQEVVAPESFFYTFNPSSNDEFGTLCSVRPKRGCHKLKVSDRVNLSSSSCYEDIVPPGTICTLECLNPYHTIEGDFVFECQDSGVWMPEYPGKCEMTCPPLQLPNSNVFYMNDSCLLERAKVGTVCEYSCPAGYALHSTPEVRKCLDDGMWSGNPGTRCKLLCPKIEQPPNAKMYPNPCTHGTCILECDVGYRLHGPRNRVCETFGEWSGSEFSCVEDVQFAISTRISILRIAMCLTVVNDNEVVKLPCEQRSKLQMWRWRSHHTLENVHSEKCLALRRFNTGIRGRIDTGAVKVGQNYTSKTYSFEYFRNSTQKSDVFVAKCNSTDQDQQWECDASLHMNKFRVKLYKLYLFLSSGPQFSTRVTLSEYGHPSSRWVVRDHSGISSICSKRSTGVCSPIQQVYGITITPAACNSEFITPGLKCSFRCRQDYIIEGDNTTICQENGLWTKDPPFCLGISKCPALVILFPMLVQPTICRHKRIPEGKRCFFSCRETHVLSGNTSMICSPERTWIGTLPTCKYFCPPLPPPLNGFVSPESCQNSENEFGKNCTFSCLESYDIVGEETRTCQKRGSWSGKLTLCRKLCDKLIPLDHAKITPDKCLTNKSFSGGACMIDCKFGFWLKGHSQLVCKNGIWSHPLPKCVKDTCYKYTSEDDEILSVEYSRLNNGAIVGGSVMKYKCVGGFKLHAGNERTCAFDGSWSGPTTLCTPLECAPLQRIYHGLIEPELCITSVHIPIGTLCSYSCEHGFILSGASSAECLATGKWSETEIPQCHDTNTYSHNINFFIASKGNYTDFDDNALMNCIAATKGENKTLFMSVCESMSPFKLWRWYGSSRIQSVANHLCWELDLSNTLVLSKCNLNVTRQVVRCGDIKSSTYKFQISVNSKVLTPKLSATASSSAKHLHWFAFDSSALDAQLENWTIASSLGEPICTYMCGGLLYADEGNLATPNFPTAYPRDILCKWTIIVHSKMIYADFSHVKLSNKAEKEDRCITDNVMIFDGSIGDDEQCDILDDICESVINLRVKSLHGKLHIQLISDHNAEDNGQGFSARWFSEDYPPIIPNCGISDLFPSDFHNTTNRGYPWQVVLVTWKRFCDGTFIGKRFVLTSAQCVEHIHSAEEVIKVVVAYEFVSQSEFLHKLKRRKFDHADRLWVHPEYQSDMLTDNIAVIRLARGIIMQEDLLHPACLPIPKIGRVEKAGDTCVVTSFGSELLTKPSHLWRFTRVAMARILTRETCSRILVFEKGISMESDSFLCAEMFYESDFQLPLMFENRYVSNDGGAVLQCLWNENWYAVGLFNFALSDSNENPYHVFTELITKNDWITSTIEDAFTKLSNVFL